MSNWQIEKAERDGRIAALGASLTGDATKIIDATAHLR